MQFAIYYELKDKINLNTVKIEKPKTAEVQLNEMVALNSLNITVPNSLSEIPV